ncbi:MAG: hypothetical protein M0036_20675 [Desulfobacteraceae bacterium]|nr:hypothetical protein [Desulfobacteraceae bacterium]
MSSIVSAIIITAVISGTIGTVIGCVLASARCNDCREWVKHIDIKEG